MVRVPNVSRYEVNLEFALSPLRYMLLSYEKKISLLGTLAADVDDMLVPLFHTTTGLRKGALVTKSR